MPGVSRDQFRLMKIEDPQPERRREVKSHRQRIVAIRAHNNGSPS